jgi:hypothetical protein
MKSYATTILIAVLMMLQGCDDLSALNARPEQVVVNLQSPASAGLVEPILRERFEAYLPSMFSSLESRIEGSRIRFIFKGGAPSRKEVVDLANRRGVLIARVKDGPVWDMANGVVDASAGQTDMGSTLNITLSDQAGHAFERLTSENLGKTLALEIDGEILTVAKINDKLGKRLQLIMTRDFGELRLLSVMLRSGPLPEKVLIVSNSEK